MLAAGTLAAAAEAWFVATRLHSPPKHAGALFWVGGLLWAAVWVGMSVSGGAVSAWLAGLVVGGGKRVSVDRVWRAAAVGWALLPCLMVMVVRGSWWVLPLVAVAAAVTVFRSRPLFHMAGEQRNPAIQVNGVMRSLDGLPPMGAPPLRSVLVAVSAQVCLVFMVIGAMGRAGVALGATVALLIAGWTAWDGRWARRWGSNRMAVPLGGIAVVLLMLALTQWMGRGGGNSALAAGSKAGGGPQLHNPKAGQAGGDFVGIILWPPQKKKVDIVPPRPKTPTLGSGVKARPLIIPFDGPYWYFKDPEVEPGPKAHVTFGEPTEAKVRSTDRMQLRMQAHQNLGLPIDLDCCREVDVTVTNADLHVGMIMASVVLTDTSSEGRKATTLGVQPVISSELGPVGVRGKVTETLRFVVPASTRLQHFDQIDVILQPTMERARMGSKVSIEQFELVPK